MKNTKLRPLTESSLLTAITVIIAMQEFNYLLFIYFGLYLLQLLQPNIILNMVYLVL